MKDEARFKDPLKGLSEDQLGSRIARARGIIAIFEDSGTPVHAQEGPTEILAGFRLGAPVKRRLKGAPGAISGGA